MIMKNTIKFFVSAVAVMATLAGCAKKEISNQIPETRTVQVVARHGQTKTTLFDSKYVRWTATDAVRAYGYMDNYVSTSTAVADGGATATFTFASGEDEIVYMVYPAAAAGELGANDWIEVTIPTEQTAVANGFADGANVAIGEYAEGEADFYSIGALVSFDIKNDNITSIKLECPNAKYAVTGKGTAKIDTENYYGTGDEITESGTANYVELKAAQGQTLTNGAKYFAVVYADDYTGMKLTFTRNDGKTATYTNPGQLKLDVNSNYTIFNTQIPDSKWQGGSDVHEAAMGLGTAASEATVNEKYAIKVGTGSDSGNMTITVGAGATSLSFYAAAWKNAGNTALTITPAENVLSSVVTIKENSGISSSSPFTLAGNEDDYKVVLLLKNISAETTFTLSATPRFVVWGATYSTGELPKYTVTVADGIVGGTVTANPVEAEEGSEITLTATPAGEYTFSSWNVTNASTSAAITVTDNKFNMPGANVNVSATFTKKGSETTYMFADMDNFAEWGTSYSKRTTTFSDGAYVELASANHSGQTITTCPVSKGGAVIFKAPEENTIANLTFTCKQWTTKTQTITLHTSADGENFTATTVTSSNFVLSAANLEDVVAVKFTFSSSDNQIGYESIKAVYAAGVTLTDVVVSGDATKKEYKAGDKFDVAGLVATAKYDDGSTKDVTANATWTVTPETLTAGTTSVSVQATYKEVTSEAFTVSGLTVTEPAVLTSISVKSAPTKVEYTVGDKFDPAGLVITRHYSDGTSDDYTYAGHTADFTFSPALTTALAETDTKVTITYKEKTVDQAITVTVPTFASLADLVAADLTSGTMVKVTFENVPIKSIYVNSQSKRQGVYFDIQKGGHDIEIYYPSEDVPQSWEAEGTLSGTMTCPWTYYERGTTWELAPAADSWSWNNLTYNAPLARCETPVITISNTGSATITCATSGAAIYYTVGTNPADPTSASTRYTGAVTMTDGQTIKAIAYKDGMRASAVASAKYSNAPAEPFEWNGGGKDSLTGMDGVTGYGLGSDYAASNAPYRVKLDTTGDYIIIEVGFEIQSVQLTVKMIGGANTSSIKVQESTAKNGTFTDVQTMTISGSSNDVVDFTTSTAFKSGSRAVKLYFTKGSNVGLGYIKITPKK